jgi:ADP-heptose:LPS heptosyltransferase
MKIVVPGFMLKPNHILLIKAHSMGIGDLLRSSAAWSALKQRWPDAQLHLLMLSKHSGYASEGFIRSHHLLSSAHFVTVKSGHPGQTRQSSLTASTIREAVNATLGDLSIDLVIDFEPYGIKTSLLARSIARRRGAVSVGIAQFPLRKYFYDLSAPSVPHYARSHHLSNPMDYTERDFVALAALGIARNGTKITLDVGADGRAWQTQHPRVPKPGRKRVVLNIGCGTPDALSKRPDLDHLAQCFMALYARERFDLHLSGADFEKKINTQFTTLLAAVMEKQGLQTDMLDWAGQLSLTQMSGLLSQADLVVSSDSGPFHMAVALGVPTLCWFNFDTPASYHPQDKVCSLILPTTDQFVQSACGLLNSG